MSPFRFMRVLALLFAAWMTLPAYGANFAFVQSKIENGTGALAFTSNTTAGHAIVVVLFTFTLTGISDSQSNTFAPCATHVVVVVCTAVAIAGGADTVTVTGSANGYGSSSSMAIAEYSSISSGYAFSAIYGGAGATGVSGGTFRTPTEAMAIVLGYNVYTCTTMTLAAGTIRSGQCMTLGEEGAFGDNDVASVPGPGPYTNTMGNSNHPVMPSVIFMYLTASTPTAFSQLFPITLQ